MPWYRGEEIGGGDWMGMGVPGKDGGGKKGELGGVGKKEKAGGQGGSTEV